MLRYQYSDNEAQLLKLDGRRVMFALMQTYSPVSTNASNNAKHRLDGFRFKQTKSTI